MTWSPWAATTESVLHNYWACALKSEPQLLSPCAAITEVCLEPVHCNKEKPSLTTTGETAWAATKTTATKKWNPNWKGRGKIDYTWKLPELISKFSKVRICLECGRPGFDSWDGKIPWRAWQPTPVFLYGESPWTEEPGGLQSIVLQRVGHDRATKHNTAHSRIQG